MKEETEVKKNIEWLKEVIEGLISNYESFSDKTDWNVGYIMALHDYKNLIDQLDEPEVLSREWIDNHTDKFVSNGDLRFVSTKDLQNVLVPKQDEVEVPQFVADCIESAGSNRESNKEYVIRSIIDQYYEGDFEPIVYDWFGEKGNLLKFYRAVDNGYTVEKEMKYYVSDIEGNILLWKTSKGVRKTNSEVKLGQYDDWAILFTEQEIKDYDPRYWAFRKPVEELEE